MGLKPGAKPPKRKHTTHVVCVPLEFEERVRKALLRLESMPSKFGNERRTCRVKIEGTKHEEHFAFVLRCSVGPDSKKPLEKALLTEGLIVCKDNSVSSTAKPMRCVREFGTHSTWKGPVVPVKDDPEVAHQV